MPGSTARLASQTYQRIHIDGTRNVVEAAKRAGVRRIALMSFLRARPNCGSPYHESKWAAEELVRNSGLDYTIVKAGMVYGRGDHMLDHLSHAFYTLPILATVGFKQKAIRPLAVDDLTHVLHAALVNGRLARQTIAITGAEQLYLSDAARRVAQVLGRRVWIFPAPLWFHYALAVICELTMKVPLVARAQVRILSEGVVEPATECDPLPPDLLPVRCFTPEQIRGRAPGTWAVRAARSQVLCVSGDLPAGASAAVSGHPILLYDGVCGLCNRLVQFILRRDAAGRISVCVTAECAGGADSGAAWGGCAGPGYGVCRGQL